MLTFEEAFRAFIVAFEADRDLQERCNHESGIDVAETVIRAYDRQVAYERLLDVAKFADLGHR